MGGSLNPPGQGVGKKYLGQARVKTFIIFSATVLIDYTYPLDYTLFDVVLDILRKTVNNLLTLLLQSLLLIALMAFRTPKSR